MFRDILVASALLFLQIQASTFNLPLRAVKPGISSSIQKRSIQAPLMADSEGTSLVDTLPANPLTESGEYILTTPLTVGMPPQPFQAILSLHARDLFVISSSSTSREFQNHTHYNSSLSFTYIPSGTSVRVEFWNAIGKGYTSIDTISLASLAVQDQLFAEATEIRHGSSTNGVYYDGVLGLGSKYGNSSIGERNVVESMYLQGVISEPVFGLTVPFDEFRTGELVFGGVSDVVKREDVKWVEVTNRTVGFWGERHASWQVEAREVRLGDGTSIGSGELENNTARIETEVMWIGLPGDMTEQMIDLMDANRLGWSEFFALDCERRDGLQDLVFVFGEERKEVRLSAYDYTLEVGDEVGAFCISLLAQAPKNEVFLGAGFLRGIHTVFDLGRNMVGFAELDHKPY